LGRDLKSDLVIGPNTAQLVPDTLSTLATVNVKGLRQSLQVYTLPTHTLDAAT